MDGEVVRNWEKQRREYVIRYQDILYEKKNVFSIKGRKDQNIFKKNLFIRTFVALVRTFFTAEKSRHWSLWQISFFYFNKNERHEIHLHSHAINSRVLSTCHMTILVLWLDATVQVASNSQLNHVSIVYNSAFLNINDSIKPQSAEYGVVLQMF